MNEYFDDGDVQAVDLVNPLNNEVQPEECPSSNRLNELQNAIDIYQNDHDVLTVEQIAIAQKIEEKQKEIAEHQKKLAFLLDQSDNGSRCLFRAEKNLRQLNKALQLERQHL
jgi:dynactin complex subunit